MWLYLLFYTLSHNYLVYFLLEVEKGLYIFLCTVCIFSCCKWHIIQKTQYLSSAIITDYLGQFASLPDMHDTLCEAGTKTTQTILYYIS